MRHRVILGLFATILAAMAALLPIAAQAADGFVQEDRTPIASRPGVGGKILRWIDSGVRLTILDRDGEWLKVAGAGLDLPTGAAWVPAARVGPVPPGEAAPGTEPAGGFRLQVTGSADLRFHARCAAIAGDRRRQVALSDRMPAELQIAGDAVVCTVRNRERFGRLRAVLLDSSGMPVASADSEAPRGAVQVRSDGPWGSAAGFTEPARFVVLRDVPDPGLVPPIGNPVPPVVGPVSPVIGPVPPMGNPVPAFRSPPAGQAAPMP